MNEYGTLVTHVIGISDVQITDVKEILNQIRNISKVNGLIIQLVDAQKVASEEHIQIASYHAQKSFQQKTASSNSIEIETLLYATGQRQIAKALSYMGITPQTKSVIVIIYAVPEITNFLHPIQEIEHLLKSCKAQILYTTWFMVTRDPGFLQPIGNGVYQEKPGKMSAVGYRSNIIYKLIRGCGYRIVREHLGWWAKSTSRKHSVGYQDILVLDKIKLP